MNNVKVFITFLFLSFFSVPALAVTDITLLDSVTCVRDKKSPSTCTYEFPAFAGNAKLIVINGSDNKKERVSSAQVMLNGQLVVDHDAFNKNVERIEADIPVNSSNSLSVQVASKPNSYLILQVIQEVDVETGAVVDENGGTVLVSNPQSPLNGVEVYVPAGSVEKQTIFTIEQGVPPPVSLPSDVIQDGTFINFEATSELIEPVLVKVPYEPPSDDDELRLFMYYNEQTSAWEAVSPFPSDEPNLLRVPLSHFSTYAKGSFKVRRSSIYSEFDINKDVLAANNSSDKCRYDSGAETDNGICVGISLVAENYFINHADINDEGLKCWWSIDTSWNVACNAHGRYILLGSQSWSDVGRTLLNTLGVSLLGLVDNAFFIDYLKYRMVINKPVSISMLAKEGGHSVLVTGWEKTGLFSGRFHIYENQDNTKPYYISYNRLANRLFMSYKDKGGHFFFFFTSAKFPSTDYHDSEINNIINSTPREYVCEAPPPPIYFEGCYDVTLDVGDGYSCNCEAFGDDYRDLTYKSSTSNGMPPGINFNGGTSMCEYTGTATGTGSWTIFTTVESGSNNPQSEEFTITVRDAKPLGTVKGVVVDRNGNPVQGATVSIYDEILRYGRRTQTGSDGSYVLNSSAKNYPYLLNAWDGSYLGAESLTQLISGETIIKNIELTRPY